MVVTRESLLWGTLCHLDFGSWEVCCLPRGRNSRWYRKTIKNPSSSDYYPFLPILIAINNTVRNYTEYIGGDYKVLAERLRRLESKGCSHQSSQWQARSKERIILPWT